jgi:microcystin-dependent protein
MPYSAAGVFTQAVTFTDGTAATAEDQNTQDSDIASGLTAVGWATGNASASAPGNMNMGGHKLTNLANGTAATDAAAYGQLSALLPSGIMFPYAGSSLPSGFLYCDGSAISRTTYASLFTAIGTTWGSGDGSTTFNLPDFRGRVLAGADNMNGTPANRLTGYNLGVTGGAQAITLIANQLPVSAYQDSGHAHTATDSGHQHNFGNNINATVFSSNTGGTTYLTIGGSPSGINTNSSSANITVASGTANITNPGGGQSHSNVQPTGAVNVIIKT